MRVAIAIAVLLTLASYGWAHGGGYVPPPDPPRIPPPDPPRLPPPPPPGPPPPPTYDPSQPPVTTPTPEPFTPNPTTPGESPLRPWARESVRKPVRTRPTGGTENTWRTWWELNREHLVGLRTIVRAGGPVTGDGHAARDPLGERRAEVLAALRKLALRAGEEDLRAAALIALGRMGDDQDARLFLRLLHDRGEDEAVQEAAAVGLGLLPPVSDAATAAALRAFVDYAVRHPRVLPTRARGLLLLAAGLRGGDDPILVATLVARSTGPGGGSDEAANLAYAFGLSGDALVVPEICQAVRKGALGAEDLGDIGRAHAASALARVGDPNAARLLAAVLDSRRAGIQSRRSAALALGKLLRESAMDEAQVARARAALLRALDKDSDPVLRGFAAVALGGAREPLGVPELMEAIDHGGNAEIKPFCGLALGLAARTLGEEQGRRIRSFLVAELDKTNAVELASALSVALGLAHAREASDVLLGRLLRPSLPAASRGAAAQGLGLMRSASPEIAEALEKLALAGDPPDLVEDVVLALGLLGRRGVAPDLATLLRKSDSTRLQARIALAMVHLDHSAAVAPLLELMEDGSAQTIVREFAAVALGIMGDRRAGDRLFETDAWFNYFATTKATNEFVRLY